MPEPIKMPAPPLAPGQIEVNLGGLRYVMNVPVPAGEGPRAEVVEIAPRDRCLYCETELSFEEWTGFLCGKHQAIADEGEGAPP